MWTEWTDWDECPITCGGGIQNRSRQCIGPEYGGANCTGPWDESRECGTIPCPGYYDWFCFHKVPIQVKPDRVPVI